MSIRIDPITIAFLEDLKANNSREWFNDHRKQYEVARDNWKAFALGLVDAMSHVDQITAHKIWRINRDIRFSNDKTPYNSHFSLGLTRKKPQLRGGYYLRIMGAGSMVAGGFFAPERDDLKRIRQEIDAQPDRLRLALADPRLVQTFGQLDGETVKTAPKGYAKDHPAIDLLRHKSYLLHRPLTKAEILSPDLIPNLVQDYRAMRPFFDVMTDILTTDENGVPLH